MSSIFPCSPAVILVLCALCAWAVLFWRRRPRITYAAEEAKISPPGYSELQTLEARAPTNRRLVTAFNFTTSTFVSADPVMHAVFTRRATAMLQRARDWNALRSVASDAASRYATADPIAFDAYVQAVTLACIFRTLFDAPVKPDDLKLYDLVRVGRGITTLWNHSKTSLEPHPDELLEVNRHLRHWLRPDGVEWTSLSRDDEQWTLRADENPLEFLVPAFETLWRVVAISFAHALPRSDWSQPFLALASTTNITAASFKSTPPTPSAPNLSVESYINEILRVYPPTRRIARLDPNPELGFIKASVELAQRDTAIWGRTAETFDPARPIVSGKLLAFGAKPLKCPGASWAPQAAGVIVAALLATQHLDVQPGAKVGGRDGWDGWLVRRSTRSEGDENSKTALGQ